MKQRSWRMVWTCALLSWALAAPAFAQNPKLKGIKELQLIAEGMDDSDASCGLTDAAFRTAVTEPVQHSDLRLVTEGSAEVYLYFRTNTLYLASADVCVTAWAVDLRGFVEWQAEPTAEATMAPAVLQSRGGILSTSRALHSSRVNEAARGAARDIVTAIRLANQ